MKAEIQIEEKDYVVTTEDGFVFHLSSYFAAEQLRAALEHVEEIRNKGR